MHHACWGTQCLKRNARAVLRVPFSVVHSPPFLSLFFLCLRDGSILPSTFSDSMLSSVTRCAADVRRVIIYQLASQLDDLDRNLTCTAVPRILCCEPVLVLGTSELGIRVCVRSESMVFPSQRERSVELGGSYHVAPATSKPPCRVQKCRDQFCNTSILQSWQDGAAPEQPQPARGLTRSSKWI